MKLHIDTANAEKIIIEIDGERYETESRQNKSQMLLPFIVEKLAEKGKTLHDVTEITVNRGPGSFTGLRVGVAVANTIGWVLDIAQPIVPAYEDNNAS